MPIVDLIPPDKSLPTFSLLNQITNILGAGSSAYTFWPFLESVGTNIRAYGLGFSRDMTSRDEAAAIALEAEFSPARHVGGVCSYDLVASLNHNLANSDQAVHSFGNSTVDTPFSLGIWCLPNILGGQHSLFAKYRTTAVAAREYDLSITLTTPSIEFFDESAAAKEVGTGTGSIVEGNWNFVAMSYDGDEASPLAQLYVNAVADGNGSTVETGAYVSMENTATPLLIGARDLTTSPANEFPGRLALPFITSQALTPAQVQSLYYVGQRLIGLL